jgi:hypothetical protein
VKPLVRSIVAFIYYCAITVRATATMEEIMKGEAFAMAYKTADLFVEQLEKDMHA